MGVINKIKTRRSKTTSSRNANEEKRRRIRRCLHGEKHYVCRNSLLHCRSCDDPHRFSQGEIAASEDSTRRNPEIQRSIRNNGEGDSRGGTICSLQGTCPRSAETDCLQWTQHWPVCAHP